MMWKSTRPRALPDLTELLAAVKYSTYQIKYQQAPRADQTVQIDGTKFSQEDTTAAIGTGEEEVRVISYADKDSKGNFIAGTEQQGLYCPATGAVGWKVEVPKTGKYMISIEYYPVEGKSSSIERTLYIDGKVPFYEARFLTCTKVWADEYSEDFDGSRRLLLKRISTATRSSRPSCRRPNGERMTSLIQPGIILIRLSSILKRARM